MTVKTALKIFKSEYPDRKPVGYWVDKEGIIINTSSPKYDILYSPAQFLVKDNGEVIGIPVPGEYDTINQSTMRRF